MNDLYTWTKIVHILSSTVLFGTGLGTAFQMWTAHRSRDVQAIGTVARHAVWADFLFTTPAVIIQPVTGYMLARLAGYDLTSAWLVAAMILYVLVGVCWLPVVGIQLKVRDLAIEAVRSKRTLPARYFRLMRWWFGLGWPAFSAVLLIFWLMIAKPALW